MFSKILIANRGEIAVRIIRACREMGIETVAVYSEADREALHTQLADEAICIGPASPGESYLNMQNIISATVLSGAQAIHPGFGFLSENSKFASICRECNITFIGPSPECIESMGNKSNARDIMSKCGIPVVPGSDGAVTSSEELLKIARAIKYPVMIKASAGGGGRGIRVVYAEDQLIKNYENARMEAKEAFGDDTIYLEKFIERPKHIEIQILADNFGNTVYLGERDCSMQRRNQKVLEEAPSKVVTEELRKSMGETAVRAAKAVHYNNAGTVEFLLDKDNNYYFMEMNTRIQVEHGITEMVTGIDLIKEQIKIAAGEKLDFSQKDVKIQGHSIECRINAENVKKGFMPSPGKVKDLYIPGGFNVRVDSAVYSGYDIPPYYDSMIAKLIVYGRNREEAVCRMKRALGEFIIEGVHTNIDFQFEIINSDEFIKGTYDTKFIENNFNG
ncbi:acetyl-CoA carboxylase biotin carboxylase subunit [Clostridium luticellarii]|jgi:acetyl-CoA carboxylase biotin carboxylase subunit|uniref:Biotin carboxylase n=1 Tax=Clostridium luticellarii TaxID=1691940 RepID=A0A2T0BP90_9CLOT|nr:acetyl-CoA carboxylase biotin carboxylase subunit [Clostridium luticellarii]MCI1944638.1 acetyl-CoA carboxylase biotin carboxylase subunit [Clostridium luticellarii]MCI1968137.1 acetyl-CoA carboxylase biotin carboxylase subunit [Clostridium luticellarii]MCI1994750.1 acetyl-CoA carboxylase biotin carboxylase subunit [Clostridium luticellarii]MCI2038982.1 acetyl-CoA carboxylase biotin carboxylase subunit [Clostridium luticellarii]PRR85642.1 Biotin carboxylase [Clostridium luticellarii]